MSNKAKGLSGKNRLACALVICGLALICGCASSNMSQGNPLDQANVDQIHKGVTTRAEMEAMFGTPDNITIMGDGSGRRMANWSHIENDTHVKGATYIPIVGMFAGGAEGTEVHQTLQATFKDNVVEDYEYSNGASNTDVHVNSFTGSSTVTNTPNAGGN